MEKYFKIKNSEILKIEGVYENIGMLDDFIFIKSEEELKEPFIKTELPEALIEKRENDLKEAKELKEKELNSYCDNLLKKFKSKALGEVYFYDATLEDQLNLMGLVIAGVDSFFRCQKEGGELKSNIPHTKEQLRQVYEDALLYKSEVIKKCGILKARVNECKSLDEVYKIKWEGGEL